MARVEKTVTLSALVQIPAGPTSADDVVQCDLVFRVVGPRHAMGVAVLPSPDPTAYSTAAAAEIMRFQDFGIGGITPVPSSLFEWGDACVGLLVAARQRLMAWRQCRADAACRAALRQSSYEPDARSLGGIGAPDKLLAGALVRRAHRLDGCDMLGAREAKRDWRR